MCYDHLAGEVAVALADRMIARGQLYLGQDGGALTEQGRTFLEDLGIELGSGRSVHSRRAACCRPCLDWSERRPHIAGLVERALYQSFAGRGWMRRSGTGRVVSITPIGASELTRHFGVDLG